MSAMRAREHERLVRRGAPATEPLLRVRAGESILLRIGAIDRQSGVSEIVVQCRACDNKELVGSGHWISDARRRSSDDHYYPVSVPIPEQSPTVVWEVHRIVLSDHAGNRRSYAAGKDFAPILFQVLEREGVDCLPPRLLGVQLCQDGAAIGDRDAGGDD